MIYKTAIEDLERSLNSWIHQPDSLRCWHVSCFFCVVFFFYCSSVKAIISDVYGYVPLGLVTCTHLSPPPPSPPILLFTCVELLRALCSTGSGTFCLFSSSRGGTQPLSLSRCLDTMTHQWSNVQHSNGSLLIAELFIISRALRLVFNTGYILQRKL